MSNETEKLTINLGVVELAQVDVLVEQGLYSNRSDFIRTSIRKQLEFQKENIEGLLTPIDNKKDLRKIIGICKISNKALQKLAVDNEILNISIIGMLVIDADVSTELFVATVENVVLRGKLVASKEIKAIIETMN